MFVVLSSHDDVFKWNIKLLGNHILTKHSLNSKIYVILSLYCNIENVKYKHNLNTIIVLLTVATYIQKLGGYL